LTEEKTLYILVISMSYFSIKRLINAIKNVAVFGLLIIFSLTSLVFTSSQITVTTQGLAPSGSDICPQGKCKVIESNRSSDNYAIVGALVFITSSLLVILFIISLLLCVIFVFKKSKYFKHALIAAGLIIITFILMVVFYGVYATLAISDGISNIGK
jgi:hypothetical protein